MYSLLSFPLSFFISLTCRDKLVSWLKIWLIPELDSPIGVDSSFMAISSASAYEEIFCYIWGTLMCGKREIMNHSLLFSSWIWKLKWPIKVLNLWSNSHTGSTILCLISFISVMHYDSNLGFLNSTISEVLMVFNGLGVSPWTNFMYHLSAWSLRVVLNWAHLTSSSVIF